MDWSSKAKRGLKIFHGQNPCDCFGMSAERGTYLFAFFDMGAGIILFLVTLFIFLKGTLGADGVFPSKEFNMPKSLVMTLMAVGYYHAVTGVGLYLTVGYRCAIGCYFWIIVNIPMIIVNLLKIYEIMVVYAFSRDVVLGRIPHNSYPFESTWTRLELETSEKPNRININSGDGDDDGGNGNEFNKAK